MRWAVLHRIAYLPQPALACSKFCTRECSAAHTAVMSADKYRIVLIEMIIESKTKTKIKYIKLKVMIESVLCPGLQYNCGLNAMIKLILQHVSYYQVKPII